MTNQEQAGAAAGADDLAMRQLRAFAACLGAAARDAVALSQAQGRAGATALSHELCQLIELHSLEAGRIGGRSAIDTHLEARYLKAALADEMLLRTDWAGRAHWHHELVEAKLFGSAHAGQRVFADIDTLLRERDPARRALARLYLLLLASGFQGRYRDAANLVPVADYRRGLFEFAYQRAPGQAGRDAVLSEQPYASTLTSSHGQRLARPSRRSAMLLLALVMLLGLSQALWWWQSWPIRQALQAEDARAAGQEGQG
jgi:type VI secretion system protein ImpK